MSISQSFRIVHLSSTTFFHLVLRDLLLIVTCVLWASKTLPSKSLDLSVESQQCLSQLEVLRTHLHLCESKAELKKKNPIECLLSTVQLYLTFKSNICLLFILFLNLACAIHVTQNDHICNVARQCDASGGYRMIKCNCTSITVGGNGVCIPFFFSLKSREIDALQIFGWRNRKEWRCAALIENK